MDVPTKARADREETMVFDDGNQIEKACAHCTRRAALLQLCSTLFFSFLFCFVVILLSICSPCA